MMGAGLGGRGLMGGYSQQQQPMMGFGGRGFFGGFPQQQAFNPFSVNTFPAPGATPMQQQPMQGFNPYQQRAMQQQPMQQQPMQQINPYMLQGLGALFGRRF